MITYTEAQNLVKKYLSPKTQLHVREVEMIMRFTARELKQDENLWGLTGYLHDLDYELIGQDIKQHGLKIKELLPKESLTEEAWHAIQSHCQDLNGIMRKNSFDYALAASDNISGLIYACTMVYPDRKVSSVKPKSIRKRMKELAFAKNVNRTAIADIEKAGITLDRFIEISLQAMTSIADEIGL